MDSLLEELSMSRSPLCTQQISKYTLFEWQHITSEQHHIRRNKSNKTKLSSTTNLYLIPEVMIDRMQVNGLLMVSSWNMSLFYSNTLALTADLMICILKIKCNLFWVNFTHSLGKSHLLTLELIFISSSWRVRMHIKFDI